MSPLFDKGFWSAGAAETVGTFRLSRANSASDIVVTPLAPVLCAVADRGGARKRFLRFFATLGIAMTAGLYPAAQGQWMLALTFYVIANVGFSGGNVFYDSLPVNVADRDGVCRFSGRDTGIRSRASAIERLP